MNYWEAVLYGAVQGIAEYLPISSSAHLILLPRFLGTEDPGLTFDVFLHIGTFLATMIYFWRDWLGVLATVPVIGPSVRAKFYSTPDMDPTAPQAQLISWKLIAIATVPALIAGALLHKLISTSFRGNAVVMSTLVIGGAILYLSDRLCAQKKTLGGMRIQDAFLVGIAQCFALIPGMSRSGSTMTGGRLLGLDRQASARFSFLISAPITLAAIVFELRHWDELMNSSLGAGPLFVAGVSSFAFGCIAIGGLLRVIRRFGYGAFAVYRVILALMIYNVLGV